MPYLHIVLYGPRLGTTNLSKERPASRSCPEALQVGLCCRGERSLGKGPQRPIQTSEPSDLLDLRLPEGTKSQRTPF